MSAEPISLHLQRIRTRARDLAKQGFRVLMVHPNAKNPIGDKWQDRATADLLTIHDTFTTECNLGVACGPQPNEKNLVCIDVDTKHEGLKKWAQLVEINGIPETAMHVTPSGGLHIFFNVPEGSDFNNSRGKLPLGIDVRGRGGQVVVPPSCRDGEYYAAEKLGLGLWEHLVAEMPDWLIDLLTPAPSPVVVERSVRRHPSNEVFGETPADWVRRTQDFSTYLIKHGWDPVGRESWRRPDKTDQGTSAELKNDGQGPLNIFTTDIPQELADLGTMDPTGVCLSVSLFDFIAAYEFDGDRGACSSHFRKVMTPAIVTPGVAETTPSGGDDSPWRLPGVHPDYWSASARNAHILAAARAAMVSPDALDLVIFSLESLLIPPSYLLPVIVGGKSPLNMLACLVAGTGFFKTSTLDAARDVMGPFPPWVVQIGMGTGEGIGATFLKEETKPNDNGKGTSKTGQMVRNDVRAAFFEADEGKSMSDIAKRQGATIIANLCKAWSGSTLGEANADPAKRRHVLDRDYRIAALVNIQPSNFEALFSEANTGTGLTGRFMFSGTLDPDIPDERGEDPGVLEHPEFPAMPVTLEIDPAIIAESEAEIRRRHRTGSLDSTLDAVAQNAAVIARMAGIACLADGRRRITTDDWAVARLRAEASAACLAKLADWKTAVGSDADHRANTAKAMAEVTIKTITERQYIAAMAERIRDVVQTESWAIGKLRKKLTYGGATGNRHRFDPALDLAVSNGWVKVVDGRVEKV